MYLVLARFHIPNDDDGCDISDYQDIMDAFGTLADWEEMLAEGDSPENIRLLPMRPFEARVCRLLQ